MRDARSSGEIVDIDSTRCDPDWSLILPHYSEFDVVGVGWT